MLCQAISIKKFFSGIWQETAGNHTRKAIKTKKVLANIFENKMCGPSSGNWYGIWIFGGKLPLNYIQGIMFKNQCRREAKGIVY